MAVHGIAKIYTDIALLVRQRRKGNGDVVAVKRLMLLAEPKALRKLGGQRQSLRDAISAIERAGATILELDTGRRRDDKAVREAMLLDAIDELSRTRALSDRIGRPPKVWTDEQKRVMTRHWFDHGKYMSNQAAVRAINADGVAVTVSQVHKLLGPSRRMAGNPKLRAAIKAERAAAPKFVYFIQSQAPTGPIKIGYANNVQSRLSALQVSTHEELTLLGIVKGDEAVERKYHARFRAYRVSGEWFRCEGRLAEFAAKLRKRKPRKR